MEHREEPRARRPAWGFEGLAIGSVVVGIAAFRFGGTIVDHDLWGRLRFGIDRLAAGRYLYEDPYSYLTAGVTRYEHDWLTANAMARVYEAAGPSGLVIAKAAIAIGLVALLAWWLLRSGLRPTRMALVMLVAVVALIPTLSTFRPQVLTTVLFTLSLLVIVQVHEGWLLWVWAFPPMFVLWVNLHGGVLAGVAVVGLWAFLYAISADGRSRWMPLGAWGVGAGALGINPLGYDHIRFLIETTTVDRPEILDWLPIDLTSAQGIAYLILGSAVVGVLWACRSKVVWPVWVPLAGLVVAPLVATRHLQLFVPAVVVLGGWVWSGHMQAPLTEQDLDSQTGGRTVWLSLAAISAVFTVGWVGAESRCLAVDADQAAFPARAVATIPAGTVGNAVVPFNWGEYVIWWRGTELQVSTDGRRETAYTEDVHQMNLDFVNGFEDDWDRLLAAAPTDVVLLPTEAPSTTRMMDSYPGWSLAYQDAYASIFLPTGSPLALDADDSIPIDGDGLCFPELTP